MTNGPPRVGANPDQSLLEDGDGLLDWSALQAWITTSTVPGVGPVVASRRLAGGTQNNLFELTREDGSTTVLRRPPRHPRPESDKTMLREARVLTAIEGHGVPQPICHAVCDDPGVIGTCFYVMSAVGGFAPVGDLPGRYATDPEWRHRLGFAMVDAIAALARVRPAEVGLGDLGRPDGWLERQVGRWRRQLESYTAFDGYDGPDLPEVERVGDWLEAHRPDDFTLGIIHGDYHLANVMASHDRPELTAVLDWELTTLGDPRLDLAWLLTTSGGVGSFETMANGFPTTDELVCRYGEGTGLRMDDLTWWRALACYKLGIILEGTNARASAGRAPVEIGRDLHGRAVDLFTQASGLIDRH
ncbi:MAG: phosphotransferase family protein [Acidimicrobiaceae bacterium]|nr:phosphotransferase family protein [Acidimicrobiaceae bacterium]